MPEPAGIPTRTTWELYSRRHHRRRPGRFGPRAVGGLLVALLAAGTCAPAAAAATAWSVRPSPNAGPAPSQDYLTGVSCVSATFCMASGDYPNSSHGYMTLYERWDGRSWSVVPSPSVGKASSYNIPYGISCTSSSSCMAVGSTNAQALAEHWDGARWSVVPVPAGDDVLNGVDCTSADACVAVGYFSTKVENSRTLVESWDGAKWSIVASPNPGPASQYAYSSGPAHDMLKGVSCASPTWCAAVGAYTTLGGSLVNLAEKWDGKKWSIVTSPDRPSISNALDAVSCASALSCMAVGSFESEHAGYDTLIESWDGSRWSLVTSPDKGPADLDDALSGVSCRSPGYCVAAGGAGISPAGSSSETLIESWDGTTWSLVASPNEGRVSGFDSVSCAPSAPCVAVGSHSAGHGAGTLVEMS